MFACVEHFFARCRFMRSARAWANGTSQTLRFRSTCYRFGAPHVARYWTVLIVSAALERLTVDPDDNHTYRATTDVPVLW